MNKLIVIIIVIISFQNYSLGQNSFDWIKGEISFVTKKNIYVKFEETANIEPGDTVFINKKNIYYPVFVISKKSSVSVLCSKLTNDQYEKGQEVFIKRKSIRIEKNNKEEVEYADKMKKVSRKKKINIEKKEIKNVSKIRGRFTIASNSNVADYAENTGNHRLRYVFSMKGESLINSNFYFDNYISFNQTYQADFTHSDNIADKLRIYRVAAGYATESYDISIGRQIKNKISALGSFDGVYFEKRIKNDFYAGIITGTRPDYMDYGFNPDLFQYGAFFSYYPDYKKSSTRGTIAFFEQKNNGQIDRRFLYAQFSRNFGKKVRFFGASEIDLYQFKEGISSNKPKITSIYGNVSFHISRQFNFSLGFDSRKNRIYYETYKDFLETLIERETRQGLRFRIGYKPFKKVTFSFMSNFRFQEKELSSSYFNAMLFYRNIPLIKSNISLSANLIKTNYLDSKSLSVRLSQKIQKRINLRLEYKYYRYFYPGTEVIRNQNRVGGSLNFYFAKKIYFSVYYEKTLQKERNFSRLNLRATKRF